MVASAKGSGIGQVTPVNIASGGITGQPSFASNLQSILSGQGILPNASPLLPPQGSGNVGLSQVPSTGMPDVLSSGAVSELMNPNQGLGQGILDFLMNPQGDTSNAEDQVYGRSPERTREAAMGRLEGLLRGGGFLKPDDQQGKSVIADLISGDATLSATGQSLAGGIDDAVNEGISIADQQAAAGRIREQFPNRSDDFIYGKGSENKGFKAGMDGPEPEDLTKNEVPGADNPAKKATVNALDEYLKSARPGVAPQDYAEYMKEFADATGLDISGQPDNSQALMAFGLALMQNKAGKGFDVGQILSATGAAGEKALPELAAARKEARAIRAKAGEYALGRKKEDQAAAMSRQGIFVVPRKGVGKTPEDQLRDRLMKGRYLQANAYELDALANAEGFDQNFEIMPGNALDKMGDLFKAPESPYSDKMVDFSLFGGADDAFKVKTYAPKPGNTNLASRAISSTEIERAENEINNSIDTLNTLDAKFGRFFESFGNTTPTVWNQVGSYLTGLGRSFGIGLADDFADLSRLETDVQYQKRFSEYLATRYAPQILQEAGKTISDADRQRVQSIVGEISLFTDPTTTAARMRDLHEFIILAGRKNMETAIVNLGRVGGSVQAPPLSEEEERRYRELVSQYNATPPASDQNQSQAEREVEEEANE